MHRDANEALPMDGISTDWEIFTIFIRNEYKPNPSEPKLHHIKEPTTLYSVNISNPLQIP